MALRIHFKTIRPTEEIIAHVKQLAQSGVEHFAEAEMREADERWWTETMDEIIAELNLSLTSNHRGRWVMYLGFLNSGLTRIVFEGVRAPHTIPARKRLYAVLMTIFIQLGCASVRDDDTDATYDE